MECSNGQIPARLLALAIVVILAAVLLGFATPANAESTSAVGAVADLAVEGSTQDPEVVPSPAPAERESSAEAPTSGDGTDAQGESVAPAPAPEPSPPPQPAASTPVAHMASQASELVGTVRRNADGAVAPVAESADSVAALADEGKSVEHALGSAQHSLQKTGETVVRKADENVAEAGKALTSAAAPLSRAVAPVPAVSDLIAPAAIKDSPALAGVDAGPLSPNPAEGSPGPLPQGPFPGERVDIRDGLLLSPLTGPGGIEPLRLWTSARSGDAVAGGVPSPVVAGATGAFSGGAAAAPKGPLSHDGNGPLKPPESSQAAASGLGGSSFVPIVALLALLALVAPAIFRRLREVPDLPAPTPFVCALERPG